MKTKRKQAKRSVGRGSSPKNVNTKTTVKNNGTTDPKAPKLTKKTRSTAVTAKKKAVKPARRGTVSDASPKSAAPKPVAQAEAAAEMSGNEKMELQVAQEVDSTAGLAVIREPYDGDTAFKLYLREIGRTPLLTPEEERELAGRIMSGDETARDQMIKANLRLVVKIAREYEGYGLPLLDLINEGNIGLMKAVERFDPDKGAKLSTYSAWWIKQSIKRALSNQTKTIRLPVHVVDKLFNIRRIEARLQSELGYEPSNDELGAEIGLTGAQVAQLRTAAIRPASLESPLGDDDDSSRVADVVRDERASTPYEELEGKMNSDMIREMVATLDPREAEILKFRFGLDGNDEQTLEEVGEKFGVTRERIRQIQEVALRKLRKKVEALDTVAITE